MTSLLVPHAGASAALVRHELVRELRGAGVPDDVVHDAVLVMSELVGNAVRHGRPLPDSQDAVRASWWVGPGAVHVEVCDGGPGLVGSAPAGQPPAPALTADLPLPSPTADLPLPSPTADLPLPSPTADLHSPSPTADLHSPSPTADLPLPSPTAEGGRGLPIIDLLSTRWGASTVAGPAGAVTVYAELPLEPGPGTFDDGRAPGPASPWSLRTATLRGPRASAG